MHDARDVLLKAQWLKGVRAQRREPPSLKLRRLKGVRHEAPAGARCKGIALHETLCLSVLVAKKGARCTMHDTRKKSEIH